MEKIINSIYGVIIYHIFIALMTLAVCFHIKVHNSEPNCVTNASYTYLATVENEPL